MMHRLVSIIPLLYLSSIMVAIDGATDGREEFNNLLRSRTTNHRITTTAIMQQQQQYKQPRKLGVSNWFSTWIPTLYMGIHKKLPHPKSSNNGNDGTDHSSPQNTSNGSSTTSSYSKNSESYSKKITTVETTYEGDDGVIYTTTTVETTDVAENGSETTTVETTYVGDDGSSQTTVETIYVGEDGSSYTTYQGDDGTAYIQSNSNGGSSSSSSSNGGSGWVSANYPSSSTPSNTNNSNNVSGSNASVKGTNIFLFFLTLLAGVAIGIVFMAYGVSSTTFIYIL